MDLCHSNLERIVLGLIAGLLLLVVSKLQAQTDVTLYWNHVQYEQDIIDYGVSTIKFRVERSVLGSGIWSTVENNITALTHTDAAVANGHWVYRVVAFTNTATASPSNELYVGLATVTTSDGTMYCPDFNIIN